MKRFIIRYKNCLTYLGISLFSLSLVSVTFIFPDFVSAQVAPAWLEGPISQVILRLVNQLVYLFLWMSARFVWITGILLDMSLDLTLSMHKLANLEVVNLVWKTIRDVSSIFFIFVLLWTSIRLILGQDSGTKAKEVIVGVIIAGVFINFSLYFTKVIIDAGNIVSLAIYRAITPENGANISEVFMQALRLQTVFDGTGIVSRNAQTMDYNVIFVAIFGFILMIVSALSFLATAFLFFSRTFMLLLVLAFSPIYFVAKILPQAKDVAKKWEGYLIGYTFFPVIYLFITYIGMRIVTNQQFSDLLTSVGQTGEGVTSSANASFGGIVSYAQGSVGVILLFLITIFFMYTAIGTAIKFLGQNGISHKLAESISGAAAGFQGVVLNKLKDKTRNLTYGGIERGASAIASNNTVRDFASVVPGGGTVLKNIRSVASGYDKRVEQAEKEHRDLAKSLGYNRKIVRKKQEEIESLIPGYKNAELNMKKLKFEYERAQNEKQKLELKIKEENNPTEKAKLIAKLKDADDAVTDAQGFYNSANSSYKAEKTKIDDVKEDIEKEKTRRESNYLGIRKEDKSLWSKVKKGSVGFVMPGLSEAQESVEQDRYKKELKDAKDKIKPIRERYKDLEKIAKSSSGLSAAQDVEFKELHETLNGTSGKLGEEGKIRELENKIKTASEEKEADKKS